MKSHKRNAGIGLLMLGLLVTLPAFAYDFHYWRTDGIQRNGSSIGQQASNQAFNFFDQLLDAGAGSFALYWVGENVTNGGMTEAPFGDVPPTQPLRDNRQQEPDVDWLTWNPRTTKTLAIAPAQPDRPIYTPNVPQAYNPIAVELSTGNTGPDPALIAVTFEPPAVPPAIDTREQILNCYYPQNAAGLPGNDTSIIQADRGTVLPFWIRNGNPLTPGLRIRDLEPVRDSLQAVNPGVGVVTHPPIFARVPATYRNASGTVVTEILPVVYLVVGTGEDRDFARVICLSLRQPNTPAPTTVAEQRHLPDPFVNAGGGVAQTIAPPNPDYFNPNDGSGGCVMWSYTVRLRTDLMLGSNEPTPVAGISFANLGQANASDPKLFVTTADGQIICLNAKAADQSTPAQDGDSIISVPGDSTADDPTPEWTFEVPIAQPAMAPMPVITGLPPSPVFAYGMAPAVARVPLDGLFPLSGQSSATVTNARTRHNVTDWIVFTADAYGTFRAMEGPGQPVLNAMMQLVRYDPLVRWQDQPGTPPGSIFRLDAQGNPERFITPPVVYQGGTPLQTDTGSVLIGSNDVGFDDQVIFSSEKGSVYYLDAIGNLQVLGSGNANDGAPTGATVTRYKFPDDDTPFSPGQGAPAGATVEPRNWPRTLPDIQQTVPGNPDPNHPNLISYLFGDAIAQDADYFSRAPIAVSLGANVNPNGLNPNLEPGDDAVHVPYMEEQGNLVFVQPPPPGPPISVTRPANSRWFYEYVGSLKPYGFVQLSRPIQQITGATVNIAGNNITIPLDRMRVGRVKTGGVSSTESPNIIGSTIGGANPNYQPGITADDTVYFVATHWWDPGTNQYQTMPVGAQVTFTYNAPTDVNNQSPQVVTETLTYPSCYRLLFSDPNDATVTTIVRGRASLTEAHQRLQMREIQQTPQRVRHEAPAVVDDTLFTNHDYRAPALYASGSANPGGTLMAPSLYRGRIIALTHQLLIQRVILGCYDPRIDPNIRSTFSVGPAVAPFGPVARPRSFDPGPFVGDDYEDMTLCSDVGGSITLLDGWMYVAHRNGHIRAFANVGGGASGTIFGNPPLFDALPGPPDTGNLVRAPYRDATDLNRGIHLVLGPNRPADPTDRTLYLDQTGTIDEALLREWGERFYIVVDFGPASEVGPPNSVDANQPPAMGGNEIDGQVLQQPVQVQIRSSNGAVQPPPQGGGVRPTIVSGVNGDRVIALVEVFAGVPSINNPLTPGTPLLWEKDSAGFTGELTYELQVVQQGVRWRWPGYTPDPMNPGQYLPDPAKEHYWEVERNQGATRFPTTAGTMGAGTPNWTWDSEWAPLLSYNNPIGIGYDPVPSDGNINGMLDASGTPIQMIGMVNRFANRNDPGRKNGDVYATNTVDGSRSGSGQPIVPVIGQAIVNAGGSQVARQILFADHGKSSPTTSTVYPDLARLRVADRSMMAVAGRSLNLRIQAAPLTKMGMGAAYGTAAAGGLSPGANLGLPSGSFEQNMNANDDAPDGMYSSIPATRLVVTKQGTNVDLAQTSAPIIGRDQNGGLPGFAQMEELAVQVDVPLYTADDVYSTRWRSAGTNGADPRPVGSGGSQFNPFFPGTYFGQPGRPLRDRAERLSRPQGAGPAPAVGEDPGAVGPGFDPNPNMDDRLRRVVVFNDANNNGLLDLLPTYREAYRTFSFQVAVKPEMKIEAQQQLLDLGGIWHGKKQPGMGAGVLEIREWQRMQQLAGGTPVERSIAAFYQQYWRPFTLRNTGNVNLAYVKPEIAYQIAGAGGAQIIGIPSEGNDPWRALTLIHQLTPAAMQDPWQLLLRTSFDDQLLPAAVAYGSGATGVWLQKAVPGAGQPGSVLYADSAPNGDPRRRDPTNGGVVRESYITLNLPTGTPLGQYSGSFRFYNDRSVAFVEDINTGAGFAYVRPNNTAAQNGTLERDPAVATFGEPIEPVTDPPFRLKVKVTENYVQGRHATVVDPADPDRRFMPTATPDIVAANGNVQRLLLSYVSNRLGVAGGQPNRYDLFATMLGFDPARALFAFDELPRDRAPWTDLGGALGWSVVPPPVAPAPGPNRQTIKPHVTSLPAGGGVISWVERQPVGQGYDEYRMYCALTAGGNPIPIRPFGATDFTTPRDALRLFQAGGQWLAVYGLGQGVSRNISYTFTADPSVGPWQTERPLATPRGLAVVKDPSTFVTPGFNRVAPLPAQPGQPPYLLAENAALPEMAWMAFSGAHLPLARTDIFLSRYRVPSLLAAGPRSASDPVSRQEDFARVALPRTEGDILRGNAERTRFISSGADFLVQPYSRVRLYLGRPDVAPGNPYSVSTPTDLIGNQVGTENTNGELIFPLDPAVIAAAPAANQARLNQARIYVDKSAGVFRLTHDSRTLAGLLTTPIPIGAPDPVLTADFTAATLRVTKGDGVSNNPVVVPVLSQPGGPQVMDASWYRQQVDGAGAKWTAGLPVAGIADRLWVFWRQSAGANSQGTTAFYKVLRPGIRVRAGAIYGIRPAELSLAGGIVPEEVNPQIGQIYLPMTYEGQRLTVSYLGPTGVIITEEHVVGWLDESGERPVPMETSVNEGNLDAFVSYEDVGMTTVGSNALTPVRHMERIWLFWSSTRATGGDLMFAALAPRLGPDPNVNGQVTVFTQSSPSRALGRSAAQARAFDQQLATLERRRPFTQPPIVRRGPYVPLSRPAAAPRRATGR